MSVFLVVLTLGLSQGLFAQTNCAEVQTRFNQVSDNVYLSSGNNWTDVQKLFGNPTDTRQTSDRISGFVYVFAGCSAEFSINSEGKIYSKSFKLGTFPTSGVVASTQAPKTSAAPTNPSEIALAIKGLDATLQQLKIQIGNLERALQSITKTAEVPSGFSLEAVAAPSATGTTPYLLSPIPGGSIGSASLPTPLTPTERMERMVAEAARLRAAAAGTSAVQPIVAENGSYKGEISKETGRPKEVLVKGYYRKDGTYVQGHYRSAPKKK